MYGAETWVLSKGDELCLGVFERKIFRRIYGSICEEAVWWSRYNEELYRLYDEADLVLYFMDVWGLCNIVGGDMVGIVMVWLYWTCYNCTVWFLYIL